MRIAIGGDERNEVTDAVLNDLRERGHELVAIVGPVGGGSEQWVDVGRVVGEHVADGRADNGITICWTGTGVSIAANKVSGVRAALCADAETARGSRRYNDANVLALSLRTTTVALAREIIDAWFAVATPDDDERENIARLEP